MSDLNKIMEPFAQLGPGKSTIKAATDENAENGEPAEEAKNAVEEQMNAKAKDYEYLLGMAMWSLTEEKIDDLTR